MVSPVRRVDIVDEERRTPPVSQGTLQGADGAALPLERTDVEALVSGPLADVTVRQRFRNDRAVAIEAVYLFPLPPEASVYEMRFRIEDRVIEGVVKEKAEARRDYEAALAQGRAATLLEEDRPSLFSLSVANVAPGVVIEVELRYQDLLPYDDGRWRFAFPMCAPPRYREPAATDPTDQPRAIDPSRDADVSLRVRFSPTLEVNELSSASHLVSVDRDSEGALIAALRVDSPIANRDFILSWRAAEEGVRPWLYLERTANEAGTYLLVITPSIPKATTEHSGGEGDFKAVRCGNCGGVVSDLSAIREIPGLGPVVPCGFCGAVLAPGVDLITRPKRARDVLVLVDRSASMRGSETQVAAAVRGVLSSLAPGDAAHVAVFDHDHASMEGHAGRFVALSPELVNAAEAFVRANPPRGGSELEAALAMSSAIPARDGRTRVVVLISDVSAGNEARLLRRVPSLLGAGAKLFVLGVGESLDRRLAERVARAGGGVYEALPAGGGATETLARFGRRVRDAGPILTSMAMYWEGATVRDSEPVTTPDLHSGEALRVLGRFDSEGPAKLVITATTSEGKPFRQELPLVFPKESRQAPGLERAWARRRVERFAELADREPSNTSWARDGLALSLRWSIVGRWTSLIAEDRKVSVGPKRNRKAYLYRVWTDGPIAGSTSTTPALTLDGTRRTIGRSNEADLHVDAGNVSRLHAEIVFDGNEFVVRDLASTNGTYVNGANVRESVLREGTRIEVGGTHYCVGFSTGAAPSDFFEYIPTQRAVDARSGEAGRRGEAVVAKEPEPPRLWAAPSPGVRGPMPALHGAAPPESLARRLEKESAAPAPKPPAPGYAAPMAAPPRVPENIPLPFGGGPPRPAGGPPGLAPLGGSPGGPPPAIGSMPGGAPMGGLPGGPPPPFGSMPGGMGAPPSPPMPRAAAPMQPLGAAPPAPMPPMAAPPMAAPPMGKSALGPLPPLAPAAPAPMGAAPFGPLPPLAPSPASRAYESSHFADSDPYASSADPFPLAESDHSLASPGPLPPSAAPVLGPLPPLRAGPHPPGLAPLPPISPGPHGFAPPGPPPPMPRGMFDAPIPPPLHGRPDAPIAPVMPSPQPMSRPSATHAPVLTPGSEPYPEHELKWLSTRVRGELDLVFLIDATGSMGPHIAEVRSRLLDLIDVLRASPLCRSLRLGVVSYRDHPPQERTYVTRVTALSTDLDAVRNEVLKITAGGGGDGPEAVTDGLFDVVRLDWRPGAARAVAWFGDAPPHGVEPTGDEFASGCPCGNHWFTQAESLREMGIAVFAIGCLPTLRSYVGAEAMYRQVARTTRGMFIPLREANLLVPLIAGAAESALDGQRIDAYLEALLAAQGQRLHGIDLDERVRWITERFRAEGLRARVIDGDAERQGALPLRFRDVTPIDVRASLSRLRAAGRLAV